MLSEMDDCGMRGALGHPPQTEPYPSRRTTHRQWRGWANSASKRWLASFQAHSKGLHED
jgi:hypothetical protein